MRICSIEGCFNKHKGLSYCQKHYDELVQRKLRKTTTYSKQLASRTRRLKNYGLTHNTYLNILNKQKHVCAICTKKERRIFNGNLINLSVDHCHKTNKNRGLLCHNCNVSLGSLQDSIANLCRAILYLLKYRLIHYFNPGE